MKIGAVWDKYKGKWSLTGLYVMFMKNKMLQFLTNEKK